MKDNSSKNFELKIIFLSSFSIFLSLLDINIVNISYPVLSKIFGVSISDITIISMGFLFAISLVLPLAGQINDIIGVKKSIVFGYSILILSSLLCALSSSIELLALFRTFQGVGAAFLSISSTSALIIYIPVQRRTKVFGYLATAGALGLVLGAPIGGFLSGYFMWQSIFLATIPASIVAMLCYSFYLPSSEEDVSYKLLIKKLDIKGFILISLGLGAYIYAMELFIQGRGALLLKLVLVVSAMVLLTLFVKYEQRVSKPLMDLDVFKNRNFSFILFANVFIIIVLSINNFIMPFYLMQMLKLLPQHTGMLMLLFSFSYGFFSLFNGRLARRISPYTLSLFGALFASVSAFLFLYVIEQSSLVMSGVFLFAYGLSFALFIPSANAAALSVASKKNAGSTAAIFRTTRQMASLMGIVIVGLATHASKSNIAMSDFKLIFIIEIIMSLISMLLLIYLLFKRREDEKKELYSCNETYCSE